MKPLVKKHPPQTKLESNSIQWVDISNSVKQVNPELAKIIDVLAPSYYLTFKKASFGSILANQNNSLNPSIILNHSCELYFKYKGRPLSYRLYKTGDIAFAEKAFDTNEWLCQNSNWELSAGCRSMFILPPISVFKQHQYLQEHYLIDADKSISLQDQWNTFTAIANSAIVNDPWHTNILEFPDEWFQHKSDPAWQGFYQYFATSVLKQTEIQRNKALIDMLFGILQQDRGYKLSPAHIEQVTHLLMLGLGGVPGFRPATEETGPIHLIQKAYQLIYRLKDYAPIIMAPDYFDLNAIQSKPLYYSCNYQTSYLLSPRENEFKTVARNFQHIHWLLGKMRNLILSKKFVSETSKLYRLMKECQFQFYHQEANAYKEFLPLEAIPKHDSNFMANLDGLELYLYNPFLNGCVSLKSSINKGLKDSESVAS